MKLLHTADLHIGKRIYEFSMLEDQKYILEEILQIAKEERVDALLLAGDIYDRSVPSTEAVELLEWFFMEALSVSPVFVISGNHDSAERLSFGSALFAESGLYIAGGKEVKEVFFEDVYGRVAFHLLPFVKPAVVGAKTSEQAVKVQLEKLSRNWHMAGRHILLTHYFVCAGSKTPQLSDSEEHCFAGGLEQVDTGIFAAYDYVALGHIHKPQCMKRGQIYYAGSPLCYSFSECNTSGNASQKSVNIITLDEQVSIVQKPLCPKRDMRILRGSLAQLLRQGQQVDKGREDYIQAVLTDKEELIDPIGSLRSVYPNTMQIVLEKRQTQGTVPVWKGAENRARSLESIFGSFYESLSGETLDAEKMAIIKELAKKAEGDSL